MTDRPKDHPTVAVVELELQERAGRMYLRDTWLEGETPDGRQFRVTRSLGSPHLLVEMWEGVAAHRAYVVAIDPLVQTALEIDAELEAERRGGAGG